MLAMLKTAHPAAEDYRRDLVHAETSLHEARVAIEATGKPVKIETEILRGQPGVLLVSESDGAEMICIGSVGIGRYARALLGSTATEVAEKAHCPVAIIRSEPDQPGPEINWIVVAVGDAPGHDVVVDQAMREAQLRKLPVLAIGTRGPDAADAETRAHELDTHLWPWRRWYPDVHIYPVAAGASVAHFLKSNADLVPLAVIGSAEVDQLAQILGPHDHPIFRHAKSSLLIIRW